MVAMVMLKTNFDSLYGRLYEGDTVELDVSTARRWESIGVAKYVAPVSPSWADNFRMPAERKDEISRARDRLEREAVRPSTNQRMNDLLRKAEYGGAVAQAMNEVASHALRRPKAPTPGEIKSQGATRGCWSGKPAGPHPGYAFQKVVA